MRTITARALWERIAAIALVMMLSIPAFAQKSPIQMYDEYRAAAEAARTNGDFQTALDNAIKSLGAARQIGAVDRRVIDAHWLISDVYDDNRKFPEAEAALREAISVAQAGLGNDYYLVGRLNLRMAVIKINQNQFDMAEHLLRQSLENYKNNYGAEDSRVANVLMFQGISHHRQGKFAEADAVYRQCGSIYWKIAQAAQPADQESSYEDVAVAFQLWGQNLAAMGRFQEADAQYDRSMNIYKRLRGENSVDYADVLNDRVRLLLLQGRYKEAEPLSKRALNILGFLVKQGSLTLAHAAVNDAIVQMKNGRIPEAERRMAAGFDTIEKRYGTDDARLIFPLKHFAELRAAQERVGEADEMFRRLTSLIERRYGANHPELGDVLSKHAMLLRYMGNEAEALAVEGRAAQFAKK